MISLCVRRSLQTQPVMSSHRGPGGFARGVSPCLSHSAFPMGRQRQPPGEPPPRSPVGHPDPHLLTHGRELGKEAGRGTVSGVGIWVGGGPRGHPHSPSPAASGAGSTAGWRSSPGSSSRAGGARRGLKSQEPPQSLQLTAGLQQSRAAARHSH